MPYDKVPRVTHRYKSTDFTAGARRKAPDFRMAAEMETLVSDLCAGWAVGKGALHAGMLRKRSEWLHEWNSRFFVLTTDGLVWFKEAKTNQLTCTSWRFDAGGVGADRRVCAISAGLTVTNKGEHLVLSAGGTTHALLRAASAAELQAWESSITKLVRCLQLDVQLAREYVRERAVLFASQGFSEHPHAGSRNHREV